MKNFKISAYFIFVLFFILGLVIMGRMVSLAIGKGKYYRGEIDNDKEVIIDDRTFKIETNSISGSRGSISSDDGTVLLSNVFVYDLYWCPSYVGKKNDSLFMSNLDTLIRVFNRINPKISIETYNKIIKKEYLDYKIAYENAVEQTESKDNKVKKEGYQRLSDLRKKQVQIKVSNVSRTNEWVRQKDIDEIDSLFAAWKGNDKFKGGCKKDRRDVRRQLASGCPQSILGMFETKAAKNKTDSIIFSRGIEGYYDSLLKGEAITYRILKVNNEVVRLKENKYLSPNNGCNIETTVNTDIQRVVKNALEKQLLETRAAWGCAIVMEVESGEIKAICNLDRVGSSYVERTDHATTEQYEPGSTFKLMTLLAALESKKVDTNTIVNCEKGHFSLKRAFAISDNNGMFDAAQKSYSDISAYLLALTKMNLDKDLKIETAQAQIPILKPITKEKTDFMRITHGYSIKIPPVYMLAYYNAVANNGVFVKPTLIKSINCPNKQKIIQQKQVINNAICSPEVIAKAKECLENVVTEGTAKRALDGRYLECVKSFRDNGDKRDIRDKGDDRDERYMCRPLVAGKTGTAYIYIESAKKYSNRLESSHPYHDVKNSSFIGYFPSHKPKYTCLVMISGTTLSGGVIAAPVCREIAEKIDIHDSEIELSKSKSNIKKNIPDCKIACAKDINVIYSGLCVDLETLGTSGTLGTNDFISISKKDNDDVDISAKQIKNLSELHNANAKDAAYILEKWGYDVSIRGKGKVEDIQIAEVRGRKKAIITLKN